MSNASTQPQCPDCGQTFPKQSDVDEHVLTARHWEESR